MLSEPVPVQPLCCVQVEPQHVTDGWSGDLTDVMSSWAFQDQDWWNLELAGSVKAFPEDGFPFAQTADQNFLLREVEAVPPWMPSKLPSCTTIQPKFPLCTHSIS